MDNTVKSKVTAEEFISKFNAAMKHPWHKCSTEPDIFLPLDEMRKVNVGPLSFRIIRNGWFDETPAHLRGFYFASIYRDGSLWRECDNLTADQGDELRLMVDEAIRMQSLEYALELYNQLG